MYFHYHLPWVSLFEIEKSLDSIEVVAFVPFVEKVRWLTAHLFVDSLEEAEKGPPNQWDVLIFTMSSFKHFSTASAFRFLKPNDHEINFVDAQVNRKTDLIPFRDAQFT